MFFIGMKLDQAKTRFFDRDVDRALDAGKKRALSRAGAFVRRTMRGSIRRRKKVADPGQPPSNRTGLLKKLIFFVYEPLKRSVIIGPAKVKNAGLPGEPDDALEILEFGGVTQRRVSPFIEVTLSETGQTRDEQGRFLRKGEGSTQRLFADRTGRFRARGGKVISARGRKVQFLHSRRSPLRKADYAAHPFAGPALEKERAKGTLETVWADSIR